MAAIISKDGVITMHRGDCFEFPLLINQGTLMEMSRYEIKKHPGAKIYFAVMEPNQLFENATIKQIYTEDNVNEQGDVVIKFTEKTTMNLLPGKYYYMAVLKDKCNGVVTVTPKTLLWLL